MTKLVARCFIILAVALCCVQCCSAELAPTSAGLRRSALDVPQTAISPTLLRTLSQPVTRASMINSLIADPVTKASLAKQVAGSGMTIDRLPTLAVTPLPIVVMAQGPAMTIPGTVTDPAQAEYDKLDWRDGITFSPLATVKFGAGKYNLGEYYMLFTCNRTETMPATRFVLDRLQGECLLFDLKLELPQGPGNYSIAIKLTDKNGACSPTWFTTANPSFKCYVSSGDGLSTYEMPMCQNVAGPGFVGSVSMNFGKGMPDYEGSQLRCITAWVTLICNRDNNAMTTGNNYPVFGGVTILKI